MKDQAIVDNIIGIFNDIRANWTSLFFSENYET